MSSGPGSDFTQNAPAGEAEKPWDHDPVAVLTDVLAGRLSIDAAYYEFGVVVRKTDAGHELDAAATASRRFDLKARAATGC